MVSESVCYQQYVKSIEMWPFRGRLAGSLLKLLFHFFLRLFPKTVMHHSNWKYFPHCCLTKLCFTNIGSICLHRWWILRAKEQDKSTCHIPPTHQIHLHSRYRGRRRIAGGCTLCCGSETSCHHMCCWVLMHEKKMDSNANEWINISFFIWYAKCQEHNISPHANTLVCV